MWDELKMQVNLQHAEDSEYKFGYAKQYFKTR